MEYSLVYEETKNNFIKKIKFLEEQAKKANPNNGLYQMLIVSIENYKEALKILEESNRKNNERFLN